MSLTTLGGTLARIAGATKESPIAVFMSDRSGFFYSAFANTVETQRRIKHRDPKLVGVFDASDDTASLRARLQFYIGQSIDRGTAAQ